MSIETIQKRVARIRDGKDKKVKPGQEERFTDACSAGDCARQGDLYVMIVDKIPQGYVEVKKPSDIDRQLVPGNTQGAKHCLDSLDGVKLCRPKDWDSESLDGPAFVLTEERTILHPTHGSVVIPAGFTCVTWYQREIGSETRKQRRAAD